MQRGANGTQLAAIPATAAPSGTPGYFGNTADGAPAPTRVDRDWANDVQEEICNVITAAGIALSVSTRNQLLAAIQSLIAAGTNAFLTDTGAANAYVLTPSPAIVSYATGYTVVFKAVHANTGASTVNVNALGAKNITHRDGGALQAGDIPAGAVCRCVYDGTEFQLEDAIETVATTALLGLAQLATNAQADARSATNVVLTPSNLGSLFAQSLGASGYIRHPGGFILQWGRTTAFSQNSGPLTVTLPEAFTTACYFVNATTNNPTANTQADVWPNIVSEATSQIQLMNNSDGAYTSDSTAEVVDWIAGGF